MAMNSKHRRTIREHFEMLLGDECALCGSSLDLEIHHKIPTIIGESRGQEKRIWDWFDCYKQNNLSLLCHGCHVNTHKYIDRE